MRKLGGPDDRYGGLDEYVKMETNGGQLHIVSHCAV